MTNNKLAVITGASSGIGKAIAEQMAINGFDLHLIARRENLLMDIKRQLEEKYHVTVNYELCDLSKPAEYKQLAKNLEKAKIDYFFNNAGTSYFGSLAEQDPERIDDLLNLLVNSVTFLTNSLTKQMAAQGGGNIVNVSSIVAFFPYAPAHAVYSAAKKYVYDLSRAIQFENEKLNNSVRVVALQPGMINTEILQNAMPEKGEAHQKAPRAQDPSKFAKTAVKRILAGKNVVTYGPMSKSVKTLKIMPQRVAASFCYNSMQNVLKTKAK